MILEKKKTIQVYFFFNKLYKPQVERWMDWATSLVGVAHSLPLKKYCAPTRPISIILSPDPYPYLHTSYLAHREKK